MRLHNPIPEINANPFPLFGGRVFDQAANFRSELQNIFKLKAKKHPCHCDKVHLLLCDYTVIIGCNQS